MLNKEHILTLAWEHSEGSGNRYVFTEENLFAFLEALNKEPAPAQDGRECCCPKIGEPWNPEKHGRDCPAHQATRPAQTEQPGKVIAYRTLDQHGNAVTDWIDGDPANGEPIVTGGSFQLAYAAPQPEQSGLVEALKRIQCLMADREAQALDGSQDRQLFVTILNIADAALTRKKTKFNNKG